MPPRKRVDLPDHVRDALLDELALNHQETLSAVEREKIRIYLATEQGLDTYEIAERLADVSQPTIARWAQKGREALERRGKEKEGSESARNQSSGDDPVRPGERVALG